MQLVDITRAGRPASVIPQLHPVAAKVAASYKSLYREVGFQRPWIGYFAVVDGICVGACGFRAPPSDGRVGFAYSLFPEYEGRGYALALARSLVDLCHRTDPALTITTQTVPADGPPTAVLRKLGFQRAATVVDPEHGERWEWHRA